VTARALALFEDERLSMKESIALTAQSLRAYGADYPHWAVAFSGGKDSSATVTVVADLIQRGEVPAPRTITALYADTRMELPPLHSAALDTMAALAARGWRTEVVLPELDDRFFVYMFGRGVPPPKNRFRWCTPQLKVEPMLRALEREHGRTGERLLVITGVRIGESAARDERIALSCSKDGSECGQGWFQEAKGDAIADTLAPLLHWRVCHVWDWLMFEAPKLGLPTRAVAEAYGQGEDGDEIETNARTGCVGCNLASRDVALDAILKLPQWAYLAPLKRLKPLYEELKKPQYRLRKNAERKKDGDLSANPMRMGPLTMDARRMGLAEILDIQLTINVAASHQGRPAVTLINRQEHARILDLIAANTWPDRWSGDEVTGDIVLPRTLPDGTVQQILTAFTQDGAP
jgi:DNA sulfur modification protein DndC